MMFSATVLDVATGTTLLSQQGGVPRSTASVGKLLLLVEFAERVIVDPTVASTMLSRRGVAPVADSGLWQHLQVDELPAGDVANLIGALSDNLAANVLIAHVGLAAVAARAELLGLQMTALHDIVRDHRGPENPPSLSTGTTDELAAMFVTLSRADNAAGTMVLDWIAHGVDLSMVAQPFTLDPLAHGSDARDDDRRFEVWSKTGTNVGVRADVGLVRSGETMLVYAAIVNWTPDHDEDHDDGPRRALRAMHRLGEGLRSELLGHRARRPLVFG